MSKNDYILLVEDDSNDVLLIQRAFQKAGIQQTLKTVRDGEQAVAYLSGRGTYANRERFPLPFLVLLDLRMPGMDGFEVLQWVRADPESKRLLVVVLTSSSDLRDMTKAYQLGANSFLVKPVDFERLRYALELLMRYWFSVVTRRERRSP